ncbi:hypothetical protein DPMN_029206 [Dreissena polymorpha]|uniref:Uncharacterized protein n=1 Tax=Dreissena polymorpha TaxID=45954 RepID=A0A9D4LY51_DREPO|nr:hypothetical protein DPMN_029206 [Dreissena polymorpha]
MLDSKACHSTNNYVAETVDHRPNYDQRSMPYMSTPVFEQDGLSPSRDLYISGLYQ